MASKPKKPAQRIPPPAEETGENEMPTAMPPMGGPPMMTPPKARPPKAGKGPKKGKDFGFTK